MLQKQTLTVVLIAGLAGFLGGALSQRLGLTVLAQTGVVDKIEAREFRLVDAQGKTLGVLTAGPAIRSRGDSQMNPAGGTIMLYDTLGRVTFSAPDFSASVPRVQPLTESR
jgi:hypothetical protein